MSVSSRPFKPGSHRLGLCTLISPPSAAEAETLGTLLAEMEPWRTLGSTPAGLAAYLCREDPALRRYAVRVDQAVAGAVCVRWPWLRGPYLELLGLAKDCQGRGIGAEILAWVEAEARKSSSNLWVVASSFNRRALDFYRRQGFNDIGLLESLVRPGYDEVLLRKRLD